MGAEDTAVDDLSPRRVVGFASNQAFMFSLFYAGTNVSVGVGAFPFERAELFSMLLFMIAGFALVRGLSERTRLALFSRPLLYIYAVAMALGSLFWMAFAEAPHPLVLVQGLLVGLPGAFLLAAWGRTFGRVPTSTAIPEVFVGSLVGALLCVVFNLFAGSVAVSAVVCILPLASVVNIEVPKDVAANTAALIDADRDAARSLSGRVLAGTLFFGAAAGLMEAYNTAPGGASMAAYPTSMLLFAAFLIGGLSLQSSAGFGKTSSLNKSYRIAIVMMMLGVIIIPMPELQNSLLPGESVVLAGYLGLEAVLICLFLVLPHVTRDDATIAFCTGFAALFFGELLGVIGANVADAASAEFITPYDVVAVAGMLILVSYVFLFTERDFDRISEAVTRVDAFQAACTEITSTYGLSRRESEILAYALRGRTSERIAGELTVTKSTVDTHLRRIYGKCGVHGRQQLLDLGERVREKYE